MQKSSNNIKLVLAYEGTHYLGWQKTNTGPSIEGILQAKLEQILQEPIALQAASRTDAGVHAAGQVVNFFTQHSSPSLERLKHSLNLMLPRDIVILEATFVDPAFHPTLHAKAKEYHYSICNKNVQMPSDRLFSWHYPYNLDKDKMNQAIEFLIGTRDFAALKNHQKKGAPIDNTQRTLHSITIVDEDSRLIFKVKGDHFLYKMVRNIIGMLVYVGRGKIKVEDLMHILATGKRELCGITAPANGLTLYRVYYE